MSEEFRSTAKWGDGAARQGSLREHNLSLVLSEILRAETPPSRAEVSVRTGLTRATVSALVDSLIAAHLVTELSPTSSQRAGRPAVPLVPAAHTVAAIGLEVNVDYLGLLARDLAGNVLAERMVEGNFRHSDPNPVLNHLIELTSTAVQELQAQGLTILGLGLALPGLVNRDGRQLQHAPNLGWRDVSVAEFFSGSPKLAGLRLRLENEANLAALAEAELLRTSNCRSFLYVSGEVGIGAAIMLDGRLMTGQHGWSGELGHTAVELVGRQCTCGATGCLEQYAGKDALMRSAGLDLALPVTELTHAVADGEASAVTAIFEAGKALGVAVANFINLVDIDTVVLGGIYAELAPDLIPVVQQELSRRVLSARWAAPTVQAATTDRRAAMSGGAQTIIDDVTADPSSWLESAVR